MKLTNKITSLAAVAGITLAAGSAGAAVTYGGSFQSWNWTSSTNTTNVARAGSAFDASSYDKLVVVTTTENGNGNTGGHVASVTYDGVALTLASASLPQAAGATPKNINWTGIWYLDNPGTVGGVIATTGNNRIAATAFGLDGTAGGAGNIADAKDVYSVNLSPGAGSMVISALGMGGGGNNADTGNVTPDTGTRIDGEQFSSWGGHVAAYDDAGGGTYAFTDTSPTNDTGIVAVEFAAAVAAVPEPSSTALLGLGGIALLLRRRK